MTEIIERDKERLWCILPDERSFYMGGLKALNKASAESCLARAMKSSENGKIKLTFDVYDHSPLSEDIDRMSSAELISVLRSVTAAAMTVKDNGLMSLQSTLFDIDSVYVRGVGSGKVDTLLVYLPVVTQLSVGGDDGSEKFFAFIRELLEKARRFSEPCWASLRELVARSELSMESFSEQLQLLNSGAESDASTASREKADSPVSAGSSFASETYPKPSPANESAPSGYYSKTVGSSAVGAPSDSDLQQSSNNAPEAEKPRPGKEKKKLSKKTLLLILSQLAAIGLCITGFIFVGPVALIGVILADAVAVALIFTLGGTKKKKRSAPTSNIEQFSVPVPLSDAMDTEEFVSFTPTIRLVGQNTPVMVKFAVDKPEYLIGRSSDCDAVLPESMKSVSGHHCRLITEDGVLYVCDDIPGSKRTGSRNGTFINGSAARIEPGQRVKLQINDTLQLANYRFKVERL